MFLKKKSIHYFKTWMELLKRAFYYDII